jgi:ubiquinone/menaquinone biosynthesis C-methylase UbiE
VDPFDPRAVRAAYDVVAEDYVAAFADDLNQLSVDRSVLDAAIGQVTGKGPVLDLGCGPGQVAEYLSAHGAEVMGLDLARRMLRLAAERIGLARFTCGDMRMLPFRSQSFSVVVAFYSIHHLPRSDLSSALNEIHRVLAPGGVLVVATHLGEGEVYSNQFLGHEFETVGGTHYGEDELRDTIGRQYFAVEQSCRRDPLPHEHQSQRIYLIARCSDE